MSGSGETYVFNSIYNIDPSNKVTGLLKICVSFADQYSIYAAIFILFITAPLFVSFKVK